MKRLWTLFVIMVLLAGVVPAALAQGPTPDVEKPAQTPPTELSLTAADAGIESLSGSYVVFDPSVGGDTCYIPGTTQTFCFRAESFTNDWEYVYNLWQKFPTDWTVTNVYVQGTPSCTSGSWGPFSWSFETAPYEVNIDHARYQASTDHCTAYYCFEVVSGSGTPDALESWYWDGDEYGSPPHAPCSSDVYTPPSMVSEPCDEWVNPQAAIPPCVLPPIMLTPPEFHGAGCACEPQEHTLAVWNNAGYDTNVNLTYTIITGTGVCGGPAQVFVPNGTNLTITVGFEPQGVPGDDVVCQIYAEDATNPANNDTSILHKHLVAGYFDPAGWLLEPITGTTGNQWAGGAVGTNPAAAGPVGYIVGGLGVGSSTPNPDLQMYDPGTGTWTQLTDMPNWRFSPVVGWIGGLLYAAGGYDAGFAATADLQVYDPTSNTWDNTTPAELPLIRGGAAGGVGTCHSGTGECLFVVGGGPDSSFANTTLTTYEYDPGANGWTQLDNKPAGSSPDGHILGAGVGCLGKIYVGGDYRGFHDFFVLDATQPSGSQWTTLASIPAAAGTMTPAFVCKEDWGKIVLIGGDPDGYWGTYNTTVFVYDIATDTWEGPLPQTLHVGQLGSVGWHMYDRVWTAGGTVGSGAIDPMPFESLLQINCEPCGEFNAWKEAPTEVWSGETMRYTITVQAPAIVPGLYMSDTLPAGVEYAGNLAYTAGYAWYDAGDNAVYWTVPPLRTAAPAPARPTFYYPSAVADLAGGNEPAAPVPAGTVTAWSHPEAVLWDNGPLVTHPAACGGQDASRLQTSLSMNTLGFGHQFSLGYRMADDFEITDPAGWQIDQITFFAYQTGAPTDPSPITGVYYQIWDGPPDDPGSSVVFGDLVTNRLLSSTFTNIQRDSETSPCANNRYIFADVASAGVTLPPGTYWLDWMTDGSLSSGPWAPPITILGQTTTGNALQYTTAWAPALDTGTSTQQGMPFVIEGSIPGGGEQVMISFDVTATAYCGEIIHNEGVASDGATVVTFAADTDVLGECDIEVTPEALWVELCPDYQSAVTLEVCNVGTCDLEWELHEMTPTLALAGSMPFVPVDVTGGGINPNLTTASPAAAPVAVAPGPEDVLWDQPLSAVNQNAYVNQDFGDYPAYSSFLADDFVNADPWAISTIFVPGEGWSGFTTLLNATALTWQIYADNGAGFPDGDPSGGGNPPVWTLTLPPNDPQVVITNGSGGMPSNTTLNLATPVVVPPGTWWLVFYPTMDFSVGGQYGRQPADTTNGYMGKFINPGGGFGYGTTWQDWTIIGATQQDIAFRLEGVVAGPGYPDFPWLWEDPITGTVPPGECQDVGVYFDATGMAPGDYRADLLILSNDPDEPQVTVPVTMTVLEPAAIVNVDYGIDGLAVAFTPTVTGAEPIDYLWDFGDGVGTSTETNPIYTYAEGGCYSVTLDVANACGLDSWIGQVCVEEPCDPVTNADFEWDPPMPLVGGTVSFTATAEGTGPITYDWAFGDGTTDTGEFVNHAYDTAGTYTVVMTATGQCGDPLVVTHDITVYAGCVPPYALAFDWAPVAPTVGEDVTFNGTAEGTEPLTFAWDFGDGNTGAGPNPTHAYAAAGTYDVVMTVTNACGEDSVTHQVVVVEGCNPPTGADFSWLPLNPGAGQVVAFTGSTVGGTPPFTFAWAFGDGDTGAGNPINHTFALSGTYTVVMTATNACGSAYATHDVVVSGVGPTYHYVYLPIIFKVGLK